MRAAAVDPAARVAVLLSGTGWLCAALLAATEDPDYAGRGWSLSAVTGPPTVSSTPAAAASPPSPARSADQPDRATWDRALADTLVSFEPDLVVSAGFMKLVGPAVLTEFAGRLVNTHPALLPAFPGAHAVRDALAAGATVTGATVHLIDAGLDTGPILGAARGRRPPGRRRGAAARADQGSGARAPGADGGGPRRRSRP